MKLYAVFNGWMADTNVHVLVIAPTEERAKELAAIKLKEEACSWRGNGSSVYPETYWTNLTAEVLCEDLNSEWASEVQQ